MKYHSNQFMHQISEEQNIVHYQSFVKKPSVQEMRSSRNYDLKNKNNMTVFIDDLNETVPFNKSWIGKHNFYLTQCPTKDSFKTLRDSRIDKLSQKSAYQHSAKEKASLDQMELKSVSNRNQSKQQKNGQVYKQIIRVLQNQNLNLKEHNKMLLKQIKKVQQQNYEFKQQINYLSSLENQEQVNEIQKLRQMNQVYQKQIQELKYILMEQVVSIHQKFSLVLSGQEPSQIVEELANTLKRSDIFTMRSGYFQDFNQKIENLIGPKLLKNSSGMVLSELLSFDGEEQSPKQQRRTFQTTDKQNQSSTENCDFSSMESPPETTFSGQLKLSNKFDRPYNRQQLRGKLQRIMEQKVSDKH